MSAFAVRTGLEPATPCVTGRYSNQLNYRTVFAFETSSLKRGCKDRRIFFRVNIKNEYFPYFFSGFK
jgi:hypothetical protein